MLLQGMYPQQQGGGMNDFTIFAPNNDAMMNLNRKNEDPNLLLKYHIVSGRYDEQVLFNMAQEKYSQANPKQTSGIRPQNNLPTTALPFQVEKQLTSARLTLEVLGFLWSGLLRRNRSACE
jgi:uncharacterized surface protein with fasciclin (FAS1) repeats